jgi:hypothetical protein
VFIRAGAKRVSIPSEKKNDETRWHRRSRARGPMTVAAAQGMKGSSEGSGWEEEKSTKD